MDKLGENAVKHPGRCLSGHSCIQVGAVNQMCQGIRQTVSKAVAGGKFKLQNWSQIACTIAYKFDPKEMLKKFALGEDSCPGYVPLQVGLSVCLG